MNESQKERMDVTRLTCWYGTPSWHLVVPPPPPPPPHLPKPHPQPGHPHPVVRIKNCTTPVRYLHLTQSLLTEPKVKQTSREVILTIFFQGLFWYPLIC